MTGTSETELRILLPEATKAAAELLVGYLQDSARPHTISFATRPSATLKLLNEEMSDALHQVLQS
ncbi:MAG: hypothetical protein ACON5O_09240 [Lentimonas sp.]